MDISGYIIENRENNPVINTTQIPEGTFLAANGLLIIARDATREDFESALGVTLDDNVVFLNGHASTTGVPIINGGERWALLNSTGALVDGITITGVKKKSYHRISADSAFYTASWQEAPDTDATPGQSELTGDEGLYISEWADASATGMYPYEFIELVWFVP